MPKNLFKKNQIIKKFHLSVTILKGQLIIEECKGQVHTNTMGQDNKERQMVLEWKVEIERQEINKMVTKINNMGQELEEEITVMLTSPQLI